MPTRISIPLSVSRQLELMVGLGSSQSRPGSAGLGEPVPETVLGGGAGLGREETRRMCVPSVVTPILGGSLFSLGLWVAFTFWTIPGPFKEVEDHLSLPSSSLGWKLLFLRPVIHSRIPNPEQGLSKHFKETLARRLCSANCRGQGLQSYGNLALNPLNLFSEGPFQLGAPLKGCWPVQEGSPSWLVI